MAKEILFRIAGHLRPVHAAHIFAPAQYLADEAFHRRQRRVAGAVGGLRPADDFARVEHFHVQRERQQRMEQAPGLAAHGILEIAKMRQGMHDEGIELLQRLSPVQRPGQPVRAGRAEALHAGGDDAFP